MLMQKLSIVLLLLFLFISCSENKEVAGGSGILEADEIKVSAETNGRVEKINFDEGIVIHKNDTLLVIDPSNLELQLESVLASEKVARKKLDAVAVTIQQAEELESFLQKEQKRISTLVNSGTGTSKQLDQINHELTSASLNKKSAQINYESIKSELTKIQTETARVNRLIKDCYPISRIDGIVTDKFIEQGEFLVAGKPIAKISDLTSLYVKVYLPTEDFAKIKIGNKANIDTETESEKYVGEVVWTSEEAEFTPKNIQTKKSRANLVYAVKLKIENKNGTLKIGMPVFVSFDNE